MTFAEITADREGLFGRAPVTPGGVVGQVWRGGSGRQAGLAQLLPHLEVTPLDGDPILASNPNDLVVLAAASDIHVEIVPVW